EGRSREKKRISDQVMSTLGGRANAIEKDVVVPDQAGDRGKALINHRDRGVSIVDIVEHPDIVGAGRGDLAAVSISLESAGFVRRYIINVSSVIIYINVLTLIDGNTWATVIICDVI